MKNRHTVHILPSTHWDREWYKPFSEFLCRLVRVMDKVIYLLEGGIYPHFILADKPVFWTTISP